MTHHVDQIPPSSKDDLFLQQSYGLFWPNTQQI